MSDADLPPPTPTPPSLESAVQEYLNVVHEVRELRREVNQLRADVGRALDASTAAKLLLGRLARHLGLNDA